MEHLPQVPDPRIERTRRHELMDLLVIALTTLLMAHINSHAIAPTLNPKMTRKNSGEIIFGSAGKGSALNCGFLLRVSEAGALAALCERPAALAPATQSVTKEGLRRLTRI